MFLNPNFFPNLNSNFSNLLDMRNLLEQVKKAFCYQKLFWRLTVWINLSSDVKKFAKSFSRSLEHFFFTVSQNNVDFNLNMQPEIQILKVTYFQIVCPKLSWYNNHYSVIFSTNKSASCIVSSVYCVNLLKKWYFVTKIVLTYCEKKLF